MEKVVAEERNKGKEEGSGKPFINAEGEKETIQELC